MAWSYGGRTTTLRTRRRAPTHQKWVPHAYQKKARSWLMDNESAALFLDPGLGKTSIVLSAFKRLKKLGLVKNMLVIAPLRVCQLVWKQEAEKWSQFRSLNIVHLHGPKKARLLKQKGVDIFLINPENVSWLCEQFYGRSYLPFDVICIDELTKFKNTDAKRFKRLKVKRSGTTYWWGLTGTPVPNGYIDLFGQMLILDGGATFGKYITVFRDKYFKQDWNGFKYVLRGDGAQKKIEKRLSHIALRMAAEDYLELPDRIENPITVDLSAKSWKLYRQLEMDYILNLPDGVVTAANAAAVYSKLSQLANGAIYLSDMPEKTYTVVHDEKLDALEELIEELNGQQLLVAYEFQHDLPRIRERLEKNKDLLYNGEIPSLTGASAKKATRIEAAWNNKEIPLLLVHPASAGHGLNLQGSSARHIAWFSIPWDLEQWDQTIRRLLRQGSKATNITVHTLRARGTIDDIKAEAIHVKDTTQARLLDALNEYTKNAS